MFLRGTRMIGVLAATLGLLIVMMGTEAAAQAYPVTFKINLNNVKDPRVKDVVLQVEARPYAQGAQTPPPLTLRDGARANLPQGRYVLRASLDQWRTEELFEVTGPTNVQLDLEVGFATLALIPQIGAQPYRSGVQWLLKTWRKDHTGKRKLLAELPSWNPRIALPAGYYVVEALHKGGVTRHTIEIAMGRTYAYTLVEK